MPKTQIKKYRSTCFFLVTPATDRDNAILHVRNWIQSHNSISSIMASVSAVNTDQLEVELFVDATSFSDAQEQVDDYLNLLLADINDAEHEEFSRGSNLLTSA